MYYRYKSKKKDRRLLKFIIFVGLAGTLVYMLYTNKAKLTFWRINQNRIIKSIDDVSRIQDPVKRVEELKKLGEDLESYKKENVLDPEAYILASKLYMKLGFNLDNRSFSEMYIDDSLSSLSRESRSYLILVIRDLNKAIALNDDNDIELDDLLSLAKAAFLTGYYGNDYIYTLVNSRIESEENISVENARFYSLLSIMSGKADEGLEYLRRKGAVDDSVQGKLFMARALTDGMKYTDAIMAFQSILKGAEDVNVQRICYLNLGRIYFNQSLYRESLEQYTAALNISADNNCRIWIAKNHFALGEKEKALIILNEAAAADPANEEVMQLLSVK
ncbi:MAG TPA: hypothetical protein PK514_06140 [Spirochaetota bacterium]|nr:hypothetical protein [Spirochaetota bacterium]